jgi:glutathione reductase (NADPH)
VSDDVDLFVIGGGSGGVRAARIAAEHGAKVAIAESRRWGGTCVVRGCVPKKLVMFASSYSAAIDDARGYGWQVEHRRFDWATLRDALEREVARLSAGYAANLDRAGVERLEGRARLLDAATVEIEGRVIRAERILIATGGAPRRPSIPGAEKMILSDDLFTRPEMPRRLLVVGGGYVGVEFAHVFAGLGVEVTMVHHGELPIRGFDHDLRAACALNLTKRGVTLHPMCEPLRVDDVPGGGLRVELARCAPVEVDAVLAAVGRTPHTQDLGLDRAGVELGSHGAVIVDQWQATNVPTIFAVGDVTGRLALTPIAIREGHAFADTVFGGKPTPFVPGHVPTAVFSQPALSTVGLSEEEARATVGDITVHASVFKPMRNTLSGRDERVLIKMICESATRRVIGLHIVGDEGPEILQAAAVAIAMGATKDDFDRTVALHPTVAEELVLLR